MIEIETRHGNARDLGACCHCAAGGRSQDDGQVLVTEFKLSGQSFRLCDVCREGLLDAAKRGPATDH